MTGKEAIVIGIDEYRDKSVPALRGCEKDAEEIHRLLSSNGDGSSNLESQLYTSSKPDSVCAWSLLEKIGRMFKRPHELSVLYFAGHGYVDSNTGEGYLVTNDGGPRTVWGIPVTTVLKLANDSPAASKVVILDCCHSGSMGRISSQDGIKELAVLGSGVTILTASKEDEPAVEQGGHGLFTSLLMDGLAGAAADIEGRITPSTLYAHIDKALAAFQQRPLYKANVRSFVGLRNVPAKIERGILRKLEQEYFKRGPDTTYPLGPENEPDRDTFTEQYKDIEIDKAKVAAYRELQTCNRHGLVVPVNQQHMWHASMHKTGCKLTPLGKYYWTLGKRGKLGH